MTTKYLVFRRIVKRMKIDSFKHEYAFLSNMYSCKIEYNGIVYKSVEAAFQAQKDLSRSEEFSNLSAVDAKRLGRRVQLRKDWEDVKLSIMKDLIRIKFKNKLLHAQLLATENAELIEGNTWGDDYWGVCSSLGKNHLGKILMEVREELQ